MNPKTTQCPICLKRVPVRNHPTPGWRTMRDHNGRDGEPCDGSHRSRYEAQQRARA